jgi:hypothetical protein
MPLPAIDLETPIPREPLLNPLDPRGRWPRNLNLDSDIGDQLKSWLKDEIWEANSERADILLDWERWQLQYWATPEFGVKNFPFQRAAKVVIPLTAIAVEAVHARLMNTVFAVEPFWSIRPRTKIWIEHARPVEEFLQAEVEDENTLDAYTFCNDALLELTKLGTCVGKSGYEKNIKKTIKDTPDGLSEPRYVEVNNGATLEYVPVANFLMRMAEKDPQEARWCGEQHEFTWGQLKKFAQNGRMLPKAVESLKDYANETMQSISAGDAEDYHKVLDEVQHTEPLWHEKFKVYEIWVSFDIDKDGEDEEIVVDFHYESETVLSIRNNWYEDLHRPYRLTQYVKVEGRPYGIGIGKQNEQFQIAVTTVHRQRLDNATLANMRMMAVKKQSGISPDEPIFPGKMWFVDDPQKDFQVIQLSEVYTSAFNNEASLLSYSERRTGVNEVLLGIPQTGTPGTATGDLARIAEGNKRFDLVLKNIRRWLGQLGKDVIANYQQFGAQQRHWLVLGDDGIWVEQVLNFPAQLVSKGAIVELTATSSVVNRQVEQQQWMSLFQLINAYYDRVIALAQLLQDPQILLQAAIRATRAADEAMKRLLQTFNVPELDELLLLTDDERRALSNDAAGNGMGEAGGVTGVPNEALRRAGQQPISGDTIRRLASMGGGIEGAGGRGPGVDNLGRLAARGVRP